MTKYMSDPGHFRVTKKSIKRIDPNVRPIVLKLNKKGIKTYYSCQGHTRPGYRYTNAYIIYDNNREINKTFRKSGFKVKKTNLKANRKLKTKNLAVAEKYVRNSKDAKKYWQRVNKKL